MKNPNQIIVFVSDLFQKTIRKKIILSRFFLLTLSLSLIIFYNNCGEDITFDLSRGVQSINTLNSQSLGDKPLIFINNDQEFTRDLIVNLTLYPGKDADEMLISFDSGCSQGTWETLKTNKRMELNQANQENTVYVKYRFKGEEETECVSDSIIHDNIPPEVAFTNAPDPWTAETSLNIDITATDSGSGVKWIQCDKTGDGQFESCGPSVTYDSLVENQNYLLIIRSQDKAGNFSKPKQTQWISDQNSPTLSLSQGPPSRTAETTHHFSFISLDTGSGVVRLECRLDSQTQFSICENSFNLENLSESSHTIEVRAVDNVGRTSQPILSHTWIQDSTAPTIHFTQKPEPISKEDMASFQFSGINSQQGITSYKCSFDGGTSQACTSPHSLPDLSNNQHSFSVVGSDGINDSSPLIYRWLVDTEKPTITLVQKPDSMTKSNQAYFTFSAQDTGSGIKEIQCKIDGESYKQCNSSESFNSLSTGRHTLTARSLDKSGNPSDEISYQWTVDQTKPTVNITSKPDNPSNEKNPSFAFQAQDSESGIEKMECRPDGFPFEICQDGAKSYTDIYDGDHSFSVKATDKAGNVSLVETYTWSIDTTPPEILFTKKPDDIVYIGETTEIHFTANDGHGSGVKNYQCLFNGTDYPCTGDTSYSFPATSTRNNSFQVTVFDNLDNPSTETLTWQTKIQATSKQINHEILENPPVDILFVVDTSRSMIEERRNLADRINGFIEQIDGLDWQIAATTTTATNRYSGYWDYTEGNLTDFDTDSSTKTHILDSSMDMSEAQTLFGDRIQNFQNGSDDERGIEAVYRVIQRYVNNQTSHTEFFREEANLAVVVLSDEDDHGQYSVQQFLDFANQSFNNKTIVWHSIISHRTISGKADIQQEEGIKYKQLSSLTNGIIGDVSVVNYTNQLTEMGQSVKDMQKEVALGCVPLDDDLDGQIEMYVEFKTPDSEMYQLYNGTYSIKGQKIIFDDYLATGKYRLNFNCATNEDIVY